MIACVRLPHFATSLEEQRHPELTGKTIILVDTLHDKQQVLAVSATSAQAGIRVGMSVSQARLLCPDLHVRSADRSHYRRALDTLLEALTTFSPQVEAEQGVELRADKRTRAGIPYLHPMQMDDTPTATCYLDLGRIKYEAAQHLTQQLQQFVVQQTQIPAKIGLASGKFPARVAATSVNSGEGLVIPDGQEASFLTGFTVELLPVDGETIRQLDLLGLYTLGQIAALPVSALLDRFGKQGRVMHRLANGRDTSPVQPYQPSRSESIRCQLDRPVTDWQRVELLLQDLARRAGARVMESERAVRQITLVMTLEDQTILENNLVLRQPAVDLTSLVESVRSLALGIPITAGVVGLDLALSEIEPAIPKQLSLFDRAPVSEALLNSMLKDLIARYGDECFFWMREANVEARLPERRFLAEKVDLS